MICQRRRRRLDVIVLILLLGSPRVASADEPSALDRAKDLFRRGNELRKSGDCNAALAFYLQSRSLVPSVANTTNSAVCLAELGRDDEALEMYDELLVKFRAELTDDEHRSLTIAATNLRDKLSRLDLSSNVEGLLIIDGRTRGQLPSGSSSNPIYVKAGTHVVRVIREGYEPFDQMVTALPGATIAIEAHLEAKIAPLAMITPDGDDKRQTQRPPSSPRAPSQPKKIWLELNGGFAIGGSGIGSGASASCDRIVCSEATAAVGVIAQARIGYDLPFHLTAYLGLGYVGFRSVIARREGGSFTSAVGSSAGSAAGAQIPITYDLRDTIDFSGPFVSGGVGALFPIATIGNGEKVEVGGRTALGVMAATANDRMTGTITGGGRTLDLAIQNAGSSTHATSAFVMPEVFARLRFGSFFAGGGLALAAFFVPGPSLDTGPATPKGFDCGAHPGTADCAPGSNIVRGERAFGPALMWLPNVAIGDTF